MQRLWLAFVAVMVISFLVLGWIGTRIYQEMPPIPKKVITTDGQTLIDVGEITAGQNVWQSLGGMEVGSIWGHGSYVAPDWTADWLHREAVFILDRWADTDHGYEFDELDNEQQGATHRSTHRAPAHEHLRFDQRNGHRRSDSRSSLRVQPGSLHRGLLGRERRLCHSCGSCFRLRSTSQTLCILLLDGMGGRDRSTERHQHLHEQLAP